MRGTYSPWSLIPARSSHCANLVSQGTVPSGTSASANRPRRHYRSSRSDTIIFHFPFSTFHYFDLRTAIQYLIPGPWTLFPETQITGYIPGIRDSGGLSCLFAFQNSPLYRIKPVQISAAEVPRGPALRHVRGIPRLPERPDDRLASPELHRHQPLFPVPDH